jgi:hypothetical protein
VCVCGRGGFWKGRECLLGELIILFGRGMLVNIVFSKDKLFIKMLPGKGPLSSGVWDHVLISGGNTAG